MVLRETSNGINIGNCFDDSREGFANETRIANRLAKTHGGEWMTFKLDPCANLLKQSLQSLRESGSSFIHILIGYSEFVFV